MKYSHIIDPETGRPVGEDLASVTVLGYDGPTVDALATAIAVLGADKGLKLAGRKGCEAYLVYGTPGDPKVAMTEGMKDYIAGE